MAKIYINNEVFPQAENDNSRVHDGSEIIFQGRVRALEEEQSIVGIDYEHYEIMAEKELQALAEETQKKFPISEIFCWHRVGYVPIGEASLRVIIWSSHRAEGLEALAWFVRQLKLRVPIWKWAVTKDGTRFPSTKQSI